MRDRAKLTDCIPASYSILTLWFNGLPTALTIEQLQVFQALLALQDVTACSDSKYLMLSVTHLNTIQ